MDMHTDACCYERKEETDWIDAVEKDRRYILDDDISRGHTIAEAKLTDGSILFSFFSFLYIELCIFTSRHSSALFCIAVRDNEQLSTVINQSVQ